MCENRSTSYKRAQKGQTRVGCHAFKSEGSSGEERTFFFERMPFSKDKRKKNGSGTFSVRLFGCRQFCIVITRLGGQTYANAQTDA